MTTTHILILDDQERNVVLDALDLAVDSPGWDQEDKEIAQELHDRLTNG